MIRFLPLSLPLALFAAACSSHFSNPTFLAPEGEGELVGRVRKQVRDLERDTGKRYRGTVIELTEPVPAKYADWRGMPVAKIRGRYQGGLTSWKVLDGHATVYFAHAEGEIPDWLIRHEALHVILLSNGIPGHPRAYSKYFEKPYWWMPEGSLRRGAFAGEKSIDTTEASCPVCGVTAAELRKLAP